MVVVGRCLRGLEILDIRKSCGRPVRQGLPRIYNHGCIESGTLNCIRLGSGYSWTTRPLKLSALLLPSRIRSEDSRSLGLSEGVERSKLACILLDFNIAYLEESSWLEAESVPKRMDVKPTPATTHAIGWSSQ